MRSKFLALGFGLFYYLAVSAFAHESRPAYLELKQVGEETFDLLWKVPGKGADKRLSLYVRLPDDCQILTPARTTYAGAAFIERSTIKRVGGLAAAEIHIEGLATTLTDALVRIEMQNGMIQVLRVTPDAPSFTVAKVQSRVEVAGTYLLLGVEHILEGIDHLLFVACLMLVAGVGRRLLITITGFTVAHSATLVLATLGVTRVPIPPVESVIALSIVFLATEIAKGRKDTLTYRFPVTVSSSFGLLHGFGFAAVLSDIGLPAGEIPTSLLFFNVGVELGQILFVFVLMAVFWVVRGLVRVCGGARDIELGNLGVLEKPAAYIIGSVAAFWMIERISEFWPVV